MSPTSSPSWSPRISSRCCKPCRASRRIAHPSAPMHVGTPALGVTHLLLPAPRILCPSASPGVCERRSRAAAIMPPRRERPGDDRPCGRSYAPGRGSTGPHSRSPSMSPPAGRPGHRRSRPGLRRREAVAVEPASGLPLLHSQRTIRDHERPWGPQSLSHVGFQAGSNRVIVAGGLAHLRGRHASCPGGVIRSGGWTRTVSPGCPTGRRGAVRSPRDPSLVT